MNTLISIANDKRRARARGLIRVCFSLAAQAFDLALEVVPALLRHSEGEALLPQRVLHCGVGGERRIVGGGGVLRGRGRGRGRLAACLKAMRQQLQSCLHLGEREGRGQEGHRSKAMMSCRRALHCLRYAVQQLLLCRHADVSQHTGAAATIKGPRRSLSGATLHHNPVFCIQFAAMLLHPRGCKSMEEGSLLQRRRAGQLQWMRFLNFVFCDKLSTICIMYHICNCISSMGTPNEATFRI